MSDFIREVNEEYRQDQFRRFIGRYWVPLLLLVVVVLAGAGAWRGYQYWRQQQAEAAGTRYFAALDLAAKDPKASIAALETLARDGPPGYKVLARFRAADELGGDDSAAATKAFDGIAADGAISQELRDIARLRAGILSVDAADPAELRRRLEPLADANSAYRSVAREMLAVAALKRGDDPGARKWLGAILADPAAGQDSRQRAGFFMSLLDGGKPEAAAARPAAPGSASGKAEQPPPAPAAKP